MVNWQLNTHAQQFNGPLSGIKDTFIALTLLIGRQGLLVQSVYDVEGPLQIKADDKKTWRRLDCQLHSSSARLCCRTTPPGASAGKQQVRQGSANHSSAEMTCVQSLHDVDVYLAVDWRKKFKAPTEHGIALKVCCEIYSLTCLLG